NSITQGAAASGPLLSCRQDESLNGPPLAPHLKCRGEELMLLPSGLQSQLWAEPMGLAQTTWKVQVAGPPPPEMFTVFVPIWYAWAVAVKLPLPSVCTQPMDPLTLKPIQLLAQNPDPVIVTMSHWATVLGVTEHAPVGAGVPPPPFLPLALAPRASAFT